MRSYIKYLVLFVCLNLIEGSQLPGCDYKYDSETKGWFKYVAEPTTWYDARKHCAQEGAVLASPTANEIDDGIANILNATANGDNFAIFTGIHATASNPTFRDADGTPYPDFRDWEPNDPDNKGQKDTCIIMFNNDDGSSQNVACAETYPYVCYRSPRTDEKLNDCGTTDPEYHLDMRTSKCYKFHRFADHFDSAFKKCRAEGGHLAIINSDTEARVLAELFSQYGANSLVGTMWGEVAFIGIHNFNRMGDWRTIHGQTLQQAGYARFSPGEPNNAGIGQNCGSIYRNGLIDDMYCVVAAAFICEKSPDFNAACSLPDETVPGFYKPMY